MGSGVVRLFTVQNLNRQLMKLLWKKPFLVFGNRNGSHNSANSSWTLSPSHVPILVFSVTLTLLGAFVMEETIAEVLATVLMHSWGALVSCQLVGYFLIDIRHEGTSIKVLWSICKQCLCVYWFFLSAEGTLHYRVQDVSSWSCGWAVSSSFFSSPKSYHCAIFTSFPTVFAHRRALH